MNKVALAVAFLSTVFSINAAESTQPVTKMSASKATQPKQKIRRSKK